MSKSSPRRVVVTGLGVVSSIGIGWQEFWPNLLAGTSGISEITAFDTSNHDRHLAGQVKNFDPAKFIHRRKIPYLGRSAQMAIAASKLALEDAGIGDVKSTNGPWGVCIGTTMGEAAVIEQINKNHVESTRLHENRRLAPIYPANLIAANIVRELGLSWDCCKTPICGVSSAAAINRAERDRGGVPGPISPASFACATSAEEASALTRRSLASGHFSTVPSLTRTRVLVLGNACAASNFAISYGYDLLRTGQVDYVLAGGADSFSRIAFSGFEKLHAVAPEKCQPLDKNRKGMIPGEGSGVLLMETLETARGRNAAIYAEIMGYGVSCDAVHMTNPSTVGIAKAIRRALGRSGVNLEDVDYINLHGTGTVENDKAECAAIKEILGPRTSQVPVSSIKSMLGHAMGAASALEAVACCLAVNKSQIPPTINFSEPDADCAMDCVPNKSRRHEVTVALNNASAFGGNNACVVVRKV